MPIDQRDAGSASSGSGRTWFNRSAALAIGAVLGAFTVHNAAGFALAPLNPVLAATIAPGHSATLSNLTQLRFLTSRSRNQLPEVELLARSTVQAAPLDHAAARTVAALDMISGREVRAEQLFKLIGANTLRDAMTHAWLLNFAYRERDFNMVVRQADIALKLDAKLRPAAFAALNQLVADGRVVPALAATLETGPEWRTAYLIALGLERETRDNQLRLLRLLRRGPTPPTAEELRTFFLVDSGRVSIEELARTYSELSPARFGRGEASIRNGDFENAGQFGPFGWIFYAGEAGFAEISSSPTGTGKSMYLEFEGRQNAVVATQYLTVAPGTYYLSLRSFGLSELSGQTVVQLSCQQTPTSRRLHSRFPVRGVTNDWLSQQWQFTVPQGCGGPILDMAWEPGTVSRPEQAYIDDIVIRPVTAAATGPGMQGS